MGDPMCLAQLPRCNGRSPCAMRRISQLGLVALGTPVGFNWPHWRLSALACCSGWMPCSLMAHCCLFAAAGALPNAAPILCSLSVAQLVDYNLMVHLLLLSVDSKASLVLSFSLPSPMLQLVDYNLMAFAPLIIASTLLLMLLSPSLSAAAGGLQPHGLCHRAVCPLHGRLQAARQEGLSGTVPLGLTGTVLQGLGSREGLSRTGVGNGCAHGAHPAVSPGKGMPQRARPRGAQPAERAPVSQLGRSLRQAASSKGNTAERLGPKVGHRSSGPCCRHTLCAPSLFAICCAIVTCCSTLCLLSYAS